MTEIVAASAKGWRRVWPLLDKVFHGASLMASIVGLIGVLENLESWRILADRLAQPMRALALDGVGQGVGSAIHSVVEAYRAIFRPLFEFCVGWAFQAPDIVQDAIIAGIFVAVAYWRAEDSSFRAWTRMSNAQKRQIVVAAQQAGLECKIGDARGLIEALEAFDWRKRYPGIVTESEGRRLEHRYLEKARARYGAAFDAFADRHTPLGGAPPKMFCMARGGGVAMRLVWALAVLVGALAAIDWAFLT